MEDYYKEKYEENRKLLYRSEKEARFYRNVAYFICGITSTLLYFIFLGVLLLVELNIQKYWSKLSISDIIALLTFFGALIGGVIHYRKLIFNWPEELYLRMLKKEKEMEEIKKSD